MTWEPLEEDSLESVPPVVDPWSGHPDTDKFWR